MCQNRLTVSVNNTRCNDRICIDEIAVCISFIVRSVNVAISQRRFDGIERRNRLAVAEFALKGLNATGCKEFYGHDYNFKTGEIKPLREATSLPNLSYKLEF